MPGRRSWKLDCADGSPASDVAAVMVPFFGHVGGEERTWGTLVLAVFRLASPESCVGGLPWRQRAWTEDGEQHEGFSERKLSASNPSAAMPATFFAVGLRVKTLDHRFGQRRRGASLPSWGRCRGAPVHLGLRSLSSLASVGLSHFCCLS
jgi:hypothetical protein